MAAINPERLILAVEKHPCLWNPSNVDYNAKTKRLNAWNSVCEEVYGDAFRKCKGADKLIRRTDVKKRWRPIQDYYRKLLDPNTKRQTKYIHQDLLEFLRPVYVQKRLAIPEMDEEYLEIDSWDQEDVLNTSPIKYPINIIKFETPAVDEEYSNDPNFVEETSVIKSKQQEELEEDSDLLFFKSLLPEMKKLSDSQKFDFKLGVMQLFKSVANCSAQDSV